MGELAIFAGPNYVVSVRSRAQKGLAEVRARCEREPQLLRQGPGFVLYAIIDAVVDRYFPILDALEDELDGVEQRIFAPEGAPRGNIEALYALKQRLMVMKHAVAPLLEGVSNLSGARVPVLCTKISEYFRDIYDHLQRLNQTADSIRDTIATAISVNLSMITLQENETMKRLAAYAALLAIPTMIAGIYGMNFEHMPELKWRYGYEISLLCHGRHRRAALYSIQKNQVAVAAINTRRIGVLLAPLIDILAFCAFVGLGESLRASNAYAFAIGYALSLSLRWRVPRAERTAADAGVFWRSAVAGFMAVFLRAGVLALLVQRCGWAPQFAILFAVALGLAVTAPRWRNLAAGLILYGFVLRLVYAGSVELMPEETYYWNYSRHLDFGYLDHPPMVAWLIRAANGHLWPNGIRRAGRRPVLRGRHVDLRLQAGAKSVRRGSGAGSIAADPSAALFFPIGPVDDAGCRHGRGVGGIFVLSRARIAGRSVPCLVVCRRVPRHRNDLKIFHRLARRWRRWHSCCGIANPAAGGAAPSPTSPPCSPWQFSLRSSFGMRSTTGRRSHFKPRADWRRSRSSPCTS